MRLYYFAGACSLAPHIVLNELGLDYDLTHLDLRQGEGQKPEYLAVNAMGAIPVLEIEPGVYLSEVQAILQYLADRKPEAGLVPGGLQRYRLLEWLSFIATELHRNHFPVFHAPRIHSTPAAQDELRAFFRERISGRWAVASQRLGDQEFCLSGGYSLADPYLYNVMTWSRRLEIELPANLSALLARMEKRPAVQAALTREGISVPA